MKLRRKGAEGKMAVCPVVREQEAVMPTFDWPTYKLLDDVIGQCDFICWFGSVWRCLVMPEVWRSWCVTSNGSHDGDHTSHKHQSLCFSVISQSEATQHDVAENGARDFLIAPVLKKLRCNSKDSCFWSEQFYFEMQRKSNKRQTPQIWVT